MTTFKTGKRPATYSSKDIRFSDVRPSILNNAGVAETLPSLKSFGGGYGTDFSDWLMLGNGPCDDGSITSGYAEEGAGDCAWAGPAHEIMESAKNSSRTVPPFTCLNILNQYAEYLGLADAAALTASNDQGSDVRDVLTWRQQKGLLDTEGNVYKIGAFVSLELGNFQNLYEALYLFENVGIGINFPESAMDQFNAGQEWTVVNGAQIEGGHYIPLVGHPSSSVWTVVTWAQRQTVSQAFLAKYVDEAWAYIDAERYNQVTGKTLQNFTDADLEEYLTLLVQGTSNPS
jgi:hypothetical protein